MPSTKPPSLPRIDTFVIAARQITDANIDPALRARIEAVAAEVAALAPTVDASLHQPVFLPMDAYPGAMQQVGCSCGEAPKTPNKRMSTTQSFYFTHLSRIGVPRPQFFDPTYASGPFKGMTWDQRYAAEND